MNHILSPTSPSTAPTHHTLFDNMATAACLSSPSLNMSPHTPDAAQLRMIALSVAEAALDSPNLGSGEYIPSPLLEQGRFDNPLLKERSKLSFKSNLGREIWNIAELAVGRKEKENSELQHR